MSKKKILAILLFIFGVAYAVYLSKQIPDYNNVLDTTYAQICTAFGTNPTGVASLAGGTVVAVFTVIRTVQDRASKAINTAQESARSMTSEMSNAMQIVQNEKTALENQLLTLQEQQKQTLASFEAYKTETAQFQTLLDKQTRQITTLQAERDSLSRQLTEWKLNTYEKIVVK